ncbi:hypothetical protein ACP275_09G003200 [Erythranthe tilingii]
MLSQSKKPRLKTVQGIHRFTLEKYSLWERVRYRKHICSSSFTVGGHQWAIVVYTDAVPFGESIRGEKDVYFGICVTLMSGSEDERICFWYKLTLLDQSGEGNHLIVYPFDDRPDLSHKITFKGVPIGNPCLIKRDLFEKSSYLKDDCLKIECLLGVVFPSETEITSPSIDVPQCDGVGLGFLGMLESGEGCDIVFNVQGMEFRAHKAILSARSSVFESIFASHLSSHRQEMAITGVGHRIFKAMLHFIYSDTLPEEDKSLVEGYAFGPSVLSTFGAELLAAADQYDLSRLKTICESHLWRSISLNRFAETLMIAQRCNASLLKNLCFQFAADNCAELEESDTFTLLTRNCPLVHDELVHYLSKGMQERTS